MKIIIEATGERFQIETDWAVLSVGPRSKNADVKPGTLSELLGIYRWLCQQPTGGAVYLDAGREESQYAIRTQMFMDELHRALKAAGQNL